MKIIIGIIKELLDKDYDKIKFLSKNWSHVQLQNRILEGGNIDLYKKAWKKKSSLEYPYVYNNHYEACEYIGSKAQELRGILQL